MLRPVDAPIDQVSWDDCWKEFARLWAYGRVEKGPSFPPETAALRLFTGENRHIASWVITRAKWHEDADVLTYRNGVEAKLTMNEASSICSRDSVKTKITKAMLEIIQSEFTVPFDKIKAAAELTKIYQLDKSDGSENPSELAGAMVIQMPTVDDFSRVAYQQQQALHSKLDMQLIELEAEHDDS